MLDGELITVRGTSVREFDQLENLIDEIHLESLSEAQKAILLKKFYKKFGSIPSTNILGGTQMIGSSIQINCDREAIAVLLNSIVSNFGQEMALELVKEAISRF